MRKVIIQTVQSNFLKTTSRMVSVGVILAIVAAITVIVLLYQWPEIFGHTHTEYFQAGPIPSANPNAAAAARPPTAPAAAATPPTAPTTATTHTTGTGSSSETLIIESISADNLLKAVAVPNIKSLEGFQSGSVHISLDDGNGHPNTYNCSKTVVGSGYNIQPMDNSPMSGTAAGAGAPVRLTTNTPPLANVVLPRGPTAGAGAGAGPLMTTGASPVMGNTSVNTPSPIVTGPPLPVVPPPATMNLQVLNTGMIHIGDVTTGSYASENTTSTPSFTVGASLLDANNVNKIVTNLASGGQYKVNVTCDLPNVKYSFPLQLITNVTNTQNRVYAYNFQNLVIAKSAPVFVGAKTLNLEVVQTAPLPSTAPNAPPQVPATQPTPSPTTSSSSLNTVSTSSSPAYVGSLAPTAQTTVTPTAPPSNQVTSLMMNTLAKKLINNFITNETDPHIKVGLTDALKTVPTTGTDAVNPTFNKVYNGVAVIPSNFTYTQLANIYNTLPSTTGTTKPMADPSIILTMAPLVGISLQNTQGQTNNAQGQTKTQQQTQLQANIPANSVSILQTGQLPIGDVSVGQNITESQTSVPNFMVNVNVVNSGIINTLKTNLASSGQYSVLITSDVPGLVYTFPIAQVVDIISPATGQTFAYNFTNPTVQKQTTIFSKAKTLSLTVLQTHSLPSTAPNSQLFTAKLEVNTNPWSNPWAPTPPNALSSDPPSTMESVLPATAYVSPINNYTFTNQSIMLDASTLAQKIRSAELTLKCNNY